MRVFYRDVTVVVNFSPRKNARYIASNKSRDEPHDEPVKTTHPIMFGEEFFIEAL